MKNINEIKIGVFVISGLILLMFGWAYLREFAIHKQVYFTVVFDDVIGLSKGSFVRINGLRVGRVDDLTLDTKKNQVLVGARIQLPKVSIPVDSKIKIRTSGYVGDKFLDIVLGMSNKLIMDGDTVIGEPAIDAFQSLEKISQIINYINPKELGEGIQGVTTNAAALIKKADSVIEHTDKIVKSIPKGPELTRLIDNAHDTVSQLNIAIDKAMAFATDEVANQNINNLLTQASVVSADLNEAVKNTNNLANNKKAFEDVSNLLVRAGMIIEQLDEIRADPLIQNELRQTLTNTNEAAKNLSMASGELSEALNRRFLLPRLFFGKLLPSKKKMIDVNVNENELE